MATTLTTPIFVDLDNGFTVKSLLAAQPATDLGRVKRGTTRKFAVQFVSAGVVQELSIGATGILGFKLKGQRDSQAYAAAALSWIKSGSGTSTVYTFTLTFSSTPIDTAIAAVDATAEAASSSQSSICNLPAPVLLEGELKWTDSDGDHKTLAALKLSIESDINRGGEVYQAPTPASQPITLPTITRQTGGTSTDLDAVPILQFSTSAFLLTKIGGFAVFTIDAGAADGSDGGQVAAPDSTAFHYTRRI